MRDEMGGRFFQVHNFDGEKYLPRAESKLSSLGVFFKVIALDFHTKTKFLSLEKQSNLLFQSQVSQRAVITHFVIRQWFMRNQCSAALKVKKVQYWDLRRFTNVYNIASLICLCTNRYVCFAGCNVSIIPFNHSQVTTQCI